MKSKKIFVVCILMFVLLFSVAACGSKDTASSDTVVAVEESAQPATATQVIPTPDPATTVDALIGNWVDINAADRFANITKEGEEYQYEDNDGKYTCTFADGKLLIKVNDTETADVYVDSATGHMFTVYQGNPSEFSKK